VGILPEPLHEVFRGRVDLRVAGGLPGELTDLVAGVLKIGPDPILPSLEALDLL